MILLICKKIMGGKLMKKFSILLLSLIVITVLVAGCGNKDITTEEYILNSIEQNTNVNSSTFDGDINITLNLEGLNFEAIEKAAKEQTEELDDISTDEVITLEEDGTNDELISLIKTINSFDINYEGKKSLEPLQLEMDMNIATAIQGMNLTLDVPMSIKNDTLYVKVPALLVPYMPDPTKEYFSADITEDSSYDEAVENSALELIYQLINNVDDSVFVYEDADLYEAEDFKVSQVVSVNITQNNIQPVTEYLYSGWLPDVITFMEQNASEEEQVQVQEFKDHLNSNKAEIEENIANINQSITVNSGKVTAIYDKDDFLRKVTIDVDISFNDEEYGTVGFTVTGEENINDINEELIFEGEIPTQDKIINIEQLMEMQDIE